MSNRKFYVIASFADALATRPEGLVYDNCIKDNYNPGDYRFTGPATEAQLIATREHFGETEFYRLLADSGNILVSTRRAEARQFARASNEATGTSYNWRIIEIGEKLDRNYIPSVYVIESRLVRINTETLKIVKELTPWGPVDQRDRRAAARKRVAELKASATKPEFVSHVVQYRIVNRPIVGGVL